MCSRIFAEVYIIRTLNFFHCLINWLRPVAYITSSFLRTSNITQTVKFCRKSDHQEIQAYSYLYRSTSNTRHGNETNLKCQSLIASHRSRVAKFIILFPFYKSCDVMARRGVFTSKYYNNDEKESNSNGISALGNATLNVHTPSN